MTISSFSFGHFPWHSQKWSYLSLQSWSVLSVSDICHDTLNHDLYLSFQSFYYDDWFFLFQTFVLKLSIMILPLPPKFLRWWSVLSASDIYPGTFPIPQLLPKRLRPWWRIETRRSCRRSRNIWFLWRRKEKCRGHRHLQFRTQDLFLILLPVT
jgi:hypothetical protein